MNTPKTEAPVTETLQNPPQSLSSGDGDTPTTQEVGANQPIVVVKRVVAAAEG